MGKFSVLLREQKKKVLVVSCDVYRPAAIEQLKTVAAQAGAEFFPSQSNERPDEIARKAVDHARNPTNAHCPQEPGAAVRRGDESEQQ